MATTPFKSVQWSPGELIGEDKMDDLGSNQTWLRDNTPRAFYTFPGGARRDTGIKIAAGRVLIPPGTGDSASATVRFNNFFSSGCNPIITTGVNASFNRRIFCVFNGFGDLQPDHTGFQVYVNVAAELAKFDSIQSRFWVTWQALGY